MPRHPTQHSAAAAGPGSNSREGFLPGPEGHYRLLFDKNPLPAWVFDLDSLAFLAVNEAAVQHYGFSQPRFLTLTVKDLHLPEDVPHLLVHLAIAPAEGEERAGIWKQRKKDGTIISVELTWQDIAFEGRRARLVLAQDVTERKRAEEELQESERRLRQLAENIRAVFWMTDVQATRLLYVSPMYEEVWGRTCESLYQHPETWQQAIHPEDRQAAAQVFSRFVREGNVYEQEYRIVRPDGSVRWVRDRAFPVQDCAGRVYRVAGIAEDVTDQKLAEERLQEADRHKDEFLALLAHELRNPLAPIRSALQVMKQPAATAATVERVRDTMERQVQHLTRLIEDLLDVSRINGGKIELRKEVVDVSALVRQTAETVAPLLEERRHTLVVSLSPEPLRVEADPTRLEQILTNLLHNSVKYTDPGGHIWLTAERDGSEVVLRVRDTGVGIAAEMLPRIFDLFVQAERRLDRSQGGLGIGLTLVRRLAELHGGSVQASSAGPGQGSEFSVRLPVLPSDQGHEPRQVTDSNRAANALRGRRVLVVDDNVDAADTLALLLRLVGQEVRVAHDGPAALGLATDFRPQIVLLDLGMPGMDGYEVARRLRQQPGLENALLVALTGWGQEEDCRRSQQAGFDHHLVKPVDFDKLQELLTL